MQKPIVETARIRLRDGATEAELITAADRFQAAFLSAQPGFLRRELLKLDEGDYLDLVHWADRQAAEAVMELATNSDHCRAYFALMDMETNDVGAGVRHYTSLARYGSV